MEAYGVEKAREYGEKIRLLLGGKVITKSREQAYEDGGLIKEAKRLDMDMWDLLEAIEGLCSMGKAMEMDDTRYYIVPIRYSVSIWSNEGNWEIETDNIAKVRAWLDSDGAVYSYELKVID